MAAVRFPFPFSHSLSVFHMKPLIQALHTFAAKPAAVLPLFGQLSLPNLGMYVSDEHAVRYYTEDNYPVEHYAFNLANALHQCHFEEGTGATPAQSALKPVPWKNTKEDIIGCSTLFENDAVTLCWFVVPPGRVLPLHNHPMMSVWQRVMCGSVRICSIDWLPPTSQQNTISEEDLRSLERTRAAEGGHGVVVFNDVVEGCEDPVDVRDIAHFSARGGGGVLHEIANLDDANPALFVDIIAPPYYHEPGMIECTYFTAGKMADTAVGDSAAKPSSSSSTSGGGAESGLHGTLSVGDKVLLRPRVGYGGPAMNAFAHFSA